MALVDLDLWSKNKGKSAYLLNRVTDLLEQGADVHAIDKFSQTALHLATQYQAGPEVVTLLLEKGIDVHAVNRSEKTALHLAVASQAGPQVVSLLLRKGAAVNVTEVGLKSVLHVALESKAGPEVVKLLLLQKGADVHAKGGKDKHLQPIEKTALHYAVENGAGTDEVRWLLKKGANLQATDGSKKSILLCAVENNADPKVVAILLQNGANMHAEDYDEMSPLKYVTKNKGSDMRSLFLFAGAENKTKGGKAPLVPNKDIAKALVASAKSESKDVSSLAKMYMRSKHTKTFLDFIEARITQSPLNPENLELIDAYIDALATASADDCTNKAGRLADTRKLREHNTTFAEAYAALDAAVKEGKQAPLQSAVKGAAAALDVLPEESSSLYVTLREKKDGVDLVILQNEQRENPDDLRVYLVHRDVISELRRAGAGLVVFQDLRKQGKLHSTSITKVGALTGSLRKKGSAVLAISYPWQGFGDPDSTGDRLNAVADHLEHHPEIEYVWWDFMCVPQVTNEINRETKKVEHPYPNTYAKKNDFEKAYFEAMIHEGGVNLIYLGAYVLSIVNSLYVQRFWTQFEYYLATRSVTTDGFAPGHGRTSVICIQSLAGCNAAQVAALEAKWAQVSTDKAVEVLGHKDVTVTNLKDKLSLLKKLPELEGVYAIIVQEMPSHVQEQMAEEQREAAEASDQDTVASLRGEVAKLKEQLSFHKSLSMPVTEREKVMADEAIIEAEEAEEAEIALDGKEESAASSHANWGLKEQVVFLKERLAASERANAKLKEEVIALKQRVDSGVQNSLSDGGAPASPTSPTGSGKKVYPARGAPSSSYISDCSPTTREVLSPSTGRSEGAEADDKNAESPKLTRGSDSSCVLS
jgi:ankyrin repeat protein